MNEENQVYFVDSDQLPPAALKRKHRLEQDPSFRTNHMEYMEGMQVIESDIKDKVLKAMDEFDYDTYTALDVERALSHESCSIEDLKARLRRLIWSRWHERQKRLPRIISEIPCTFLHHCILPTTVRITVSIVDSTVITIYAGKN